MTEIIRLADHRPTAAPPSQDPKTDLPPQPSVDMQALRRRVRTTGLILVALLIAKLVAVILWIAPSLVLPGDAPMWQSSALGWLGDNTGLRAALLATTGLAFYGTLAFAAHQLWPALPCPHDGPAGRRSAKPETRRSRRPSRSARKAGQPQGSYRGPRPCS